MTLAGPKTLLKSLQRPPVEPPGRQKGAQGDPREAKMTPKRLQGQVFRAFWGGKWSENGFFCRFSTKRADFGGQEHSRPILARFWMDFSQKSLPKSTGESDANFEKAFVETAIDRQSEFEQTLEKPMFYLSKTILFVMSTKKQTRQRSARN